jgi:hypothetical protein
MTELIKPDSRVTRDPKNEAVRTLFNPSLGPKKETRMAFTPSVSRDLAQNVLKENAELFNWKSDLPDLHIQRVNESPNAQSVRFEQNYKGVPVDSSEVVVNVHPDGSVQSVYNNYHYNIPQDLDPEKIKFSAAQAREIVKQLLTVYDSYELSEPTLIIYRYQRVENHPPKSPGKPTNHRTNFLSAVDTQLSENWPEGDLPKEGQYFLAWDFTATTHKPSHGWRILIDAMTGI